MINPEARKRLADLMEQRRVNLKLTWREVAETGEVSYEAVRAARHGPGDIRALTRAGIEDGLHWERGSIARILEGSEPVPAAREVVVDLPTATAPSPRHRKETDADPELAPHLQGVLEDLSRAMRKYGPGFTGAQAFGKQHEADAWDDRYHEMPDDTARAILIARYRWLDAEWTRDQRNAVLAHG